MEEDVLTENLTNLISKKLEDHLFLKVPFSEEESSYFEKIKNLFHDQEIWLINKIRKKKAYLADFYETWVPIFEKVEKKELKYLLQLYGSSALAKLSINIDFDITDPRVTKVMANKSRLFSTSVCTTTAKQLRIKLAEAVTAGATEKELINSIKDYFSTAEKYRVRRIARTEVTWGQFEANEQGWIQSEVVKGKYWQNGPNPCPFCQELAKRFSATNYLNLGEPFVRIGDKLIARDENDKKIEMDVSYEDILHPPAHPHCACRISPIIF